MAASLYKKIAYEAGNKILAIGKNYASHVKEMGGQNPPDPVIFQKPLSSIVSPDEKVLRLPSHGREIHHEVELGFVVSKKGKDINPKDWKDYVGGYFLALDLTDRDLQAYFKKSSLPWDLSKGQDGFMPVSKFVDPERVNDPHNLELKLQINEKTVQNDTTALMIHQIPKILAFCSQYMTLNPGDLILTGTPSGVGPIKDGDKLEASLLQKGEELARISLDVRKEAIRSKL